MVALLQLALTKSRRRRQRGHSVEAWGFSPMNRSDRRSGASAPARSVPPTAAPAPVALGPGPCSSGFTLLELMIVLAIIAILATIAVPSYVANIRRAKEAVLRQDLQTMRSAIEGYTYDKQKAPQTLDDLVQAGYIKAIPKDPMTDRADTWIPAQGDMYTTTDETQSGGMDDIHSASQSIATDGTLYSTW